MNAPPLEPDYDRRIKSYMTYAAIGAGLVGFVSGALLGGLVVFLFIR
jgi:hypothetical protein